MWVFWVGKGKATLVEAGINALLAVERCVESNWPTSSIGRFVAPPTDQKRLGVPTSEHLICNSRSCEVHV